MSKEWVIERSELEREPVFNKLHNPNKIEELDQQLEEVCKNAKDDDLVQKICRKIIEEVVNIMQHDDAWNELAVQSKFKTEGKNYKFRIRYDGGNYYDPEVHNLNNVVGSSVSKFDEYTREPVEIDDNGIVTIRIKIKLGVNE